MKFDILTLNTAVELVGTVICLMVIFCRRFFVGSSREEVQTDFTFLVLSEAFILFFSAVSGILTGQRTAAADYLMPVLCFFKNMFTYVFYGFFTDFIVQSFQLKKSGIAHKLSWIIIAIGAAGLCINAFKPIFYYIDENNICRSTKLFYLSQLPCLLIFAENLIIIIINRKKVSNRILASFLAYMFIPAFALIIQLFLSGLDLVNIALIIVLMLMFVVMQNQFVNEYIEQKRRLQENNYKMIISQVKPHFIFNSLTAIAQLCDDDPALAKKTTVSFAKYLRGNLSSLDKTEPIPFEDELNHIRNYLSIESVRFGKYLKIVYDIETVNFKVPVLSIQPIVENAVKHGVGMKEGGGTVTVSTREADDCITVKVADDGVGFDTGSTFSDGGHIGLSSSAERLKTMCGAELTAVSEENKGTEIIIRIPKVKAG